MKRALFVDDAGDLDRAYRRAVKDMNAALRHPDLKEGLAALKERRPPNFLASE
jgi:enoyl-CoA hydratase/carnithine racemase